MHLSLARRIWKHLPAAVRESSIGVTFGRHLHGLVQRHSERRQSFGTFFLRNRAEMKLICRLLSERPQGSDLDLCFLACSKGAELYSMLWALRSARPDLSIRVHAVDISPEILEFAKAGVYTLPASNRPSGAGPENGLTHIALNTWIDQNAPLFERVTTNELEAMCDVQGGQAAIKPWLTEGITWLVGDAGTPAMIEAIGPQDIVIANRFLCHMSPDAAEGCLRNIAQLVRPGGYLFVSGVDLDVRTRVAQQMSWEPVTEMMRELHDGDPSIRKGWPTEYWGLEPFSESRPDWKIRYASVFRIDLAATSVPDASIFVSAVSNTAVASI